MSKHAANASTPEHIATAKQLVVESAVLLKNEGGALPLLKPSAAAKATGRSGVAIFGLAKEKNAIFGGTGSGSVVPSHAVSPWAGTTPHDHCWRLGCILPRVPAMIVRDRHHGPGQPGAQERLRIVQ